MARPALKKRKQKEQEKGEKEDDGDEEDEGSEKAAFKKSVREDRKLHKAVGKIGKKIGVKMPDEEE